MHQVSEIETRAVTDFAYAHSNIAAVFSFSPNDNLNHPWKEGKKASPAKPDQRARKPIEQVDSKDTPYYAHIPGEFKKINTHSV